MEGTKPLGVSTFQNRLAFVLLKNGNKINLIGFVSEYQKIFGENLEISLGKKDTLCNIVSEYGGDVVKLDGDHIHLIKKYSEVDVRVRTLIDERKRLKQHLVDVLLASGKNGLPLTQLTTRYYELHESSLDIKNFENIRAANFENIETFLKTYFFDVFVFSPNGKETWISLTDKERRKSVSVKENAAKEAKGFNNTSAPSGKSFKEIMMEQQLEAEVQQQQDLKAQRQQEEKKVKAAAKQQKKNPNDAAQQKLPASTTHTAQSRNVNPLTPLNTNTGDNLVVNASGIFASNISLAWNEKLKQEPVFSFTMTNAGEGNSSYFTDEEVNDRFSIIRREFSQKGERFNILDMIEALCQFYKVKSVKGIKTSKFKGGMYHESCIKAVTDYLKLYDEVNIFIQGYCMASGLAILHELEQEICKLTEKANFADLRLGPLQTFPLVYKHFKYPPDAESITKITSFDVMKALWHFMGQNKKEKKEKVDMQAFLTDLAQKHGLQSPFELGVKIRSFGLLIKLVRRAMFGDMDKRKELERQIKVDIEEDLERQLRNMRKELTGKQEAGRRVGSFKNMMQQVAGLRIEDAIMKIFDYTCKVRDSAHNNIQTSGIFGAARRIVETMVIIRNSPLLVKLFHVIIANGVFQQLEKEDVDMLRFLGFENAVEQLVKERTPKHHLPVASADNSGMVKMFHIAEDYLIRQCKQYFENCGFPVDLATLVRLESNIARSCCPEAPGFHAMGHGSFLQFLDGHDELVRILGEYVTLSSLTSHHTATSRVSREETKEFVLQCQGYTQEKSLITLYCQQFGLDERVAEVLEDLDTVIKSTEICQEIRKPTVFYEMPLHLGFSDGSVKDFDTSSASSIGEDCGLEEEALKCLASAPLLEDLEKWCHWKLLFKSKCGELKTFIRKRRSGEDIPRTYALEVEPGLLLKIRPDTTPEDFRNALELGDPVEAAGILVSIICGHGGLAKAPLALFTVSIQSALLGMKEGMETDFTVVNEGPLVFILECLCRIPLKLCAKIFNKVFLTPLQYVYGTNDASKLLLDACKTSEERSYLHQLGALTVVQEWIQDFREKKIDVGEKDNEDKKSNKSQKDRTTDLRETVHQVSKPEAVFEFLEEKEMQGTRLKKEEEEIGSATSEESTPDDELSDDVADEQAAFCKDIIEEIRREEFGVGEVLGEKEAQLIKANHDRLGRSLERLSKELYSKDTHFVLELVQNADDNKYPGRLFADSSDEKPAVAFIIEEKHVTMLNNEMGFSAENIRAICDVGKTTKGVHRKGYIGQKGIGFKSIFRVTDCPEVHSNGFHIRFDAKSGSIGYILPEWVENTQDILSYTPPDLDISIDWMTQISLPLKAEILETRSPLSARFHDIHPSLLLFLNRLQVIIIDDKVNSKYSLMTKRVLEDHLVELTINQRPSLWMVLTEEVPIKVRPDIDRTDVSLAFPIDDLSTVSFKSKALPVQPVFAFLPLRSYGFKFVIQADFEVPSSREDIDRDSPWNQWILDKIPGLVVKAFYRFKEFKAHSSFTALSGVGKFFNFMSLEEEILGSFQPTAGRIIKLLQAEECIPVESSSDLEDADRETSESEHEWRMPSSVLMQDSLLKAIVSSSQLKEYLGLYYMVGSVQKAVSSALLGALGVQKISFYHLVEIVKARLNSKEDNSRLSCWVGKWLYCLAQFLEAEHDCSDETLQKIKELPVFPLADGTYKPVADGGVFFPTQQTATATEAKSMKETKWARMLDKDLKTLDRGLLVDLDEVGRLKVTHLLEDLGVKTATPREIIKNHILPVFRSEIWKNKSQELIQSYVIFIKRHWERDGSAVDVEELKKCIVVVTSNGLVQPVQTPVYFSKKYGNKIDYQVLFPGLKWTILSDSYLESDSMKSWQTFFESVGISYFFNISKVTRTLHEAELDRSFWSSFAKDWHVPQDSLFHVEDYTSPQILELLQQDDHDVNTKLAVLIDSCWEDHLSNLNLHQQRVVVRDSRGEVITYTYSSLTLLLQSRKWLLGDCNGKQDLYSPQQLFLPVEEIQDVLSSFCPYVVAKLKCEKFISFLKVRKDLTEDDVYGYVMNWIEKMEFKTSVRHMQHVYNYLCKASASLKEHLGDKNLIFLPVDTYVSQKEPTTGTFHQKDDVCWNDPSGILKEKADMFKDKIYVLSRIYDQSVKQFFCDVLSVRKTPTVRDYLDVATCLVSEITLPDARAHMGLLSVFAAVGRKCVLKSEKENVKLIFDDYDSLTKVYDAFADYMDPCICEFVYSNVQGLKIFPTERNTFVSLERKPLLADKQELHDIFKDEKDVEFLNLNQLSQLLFEIFNGSKKQIASTKKSLPLIGGVLLFLKACDVRGLSSIALDPQPQTVYSEKGCLKWEEMLIDVLGLIQRILYYKYPILYENVVSSKLPQRLAHAQFNTTHRLDAVYRLQGFPDVNVAKNMVFASETSDYEGGRIYFYFLEEQLDEKEEIISEFVRLFTGKDEHARDDVTTNIMAVLASKGSSREKTLTKKGIKKLKEDEIVWTMPEPVKQNVVAPVPKSGQENKRQHQDNEIAAWPPPAPTECMMVTTTQECSNRNVMERMQFDIPAPPAEMMTRNANREDMSQSATGPPRTGEKRREGLDLPVQKTNVSFVEHATGITGREMSQGQQEITKITAGEKIISRSSDRSEEQRRVFKDPTLDSSISAPILSQKDSPPPTSSAGHVDDDHEVPRPQGNEIKDAISPPKITKDVVTSFPSPTQSVLRDTGTTLELAYEDIPLDTMDKEDHVHTLIQKSNSVVESDIGRIGEELVYHHLLHFYAEDVQKGTLEIVWENMEQESGAPYDLKLRWMDEDPVRQTVIYIEVKSTSTNESKGFEISGQELELAFQLGEKYHLYRVLGLRDSSSLQLKKLKGLSQHLMNKTVKLYIVL